MSKMIPNPFKRNNLQDSDRSPEHARPTKSASIPTRAVNNKKRGRPQIDYPANQSPTMNNIIYAAGFYEGEGHFSGNVVQLPQNDTEKLIWLKDRFGGKVNGPYEGKPAGNNYYVWTLTRERALGFMFTIFTFLSISRRKQFISALHGKSIKRVYQKTVSDKGISEAFVKRNLERNIKQNRPKGKLALFGVKK